MPDPFKDYQPGLASPAGRWFEVTPSDSEDLAVRPRALWIGTGGTIALVGDDGVEASFTVPDAFILPLRPVRVKSTGTDAGEIRGLL